MNTTEAPQNDTQPQLHTPKVGFRRRVWLNKFPLALAIVAIGGICLMAYLGATHVQRSSAAGQARDHFIDIRATQATQQFDGGLIVHDGLYWRSNVQRVEVNITVGSCERARGYFMTPSHPTRLQEVSSLHVEMPSVNPEGPIAYVSVSADNFYTALFNSGMRHCVVGDERFR